MKNKSLSSPQNRCHDKTRSNNEKDDDDDDRASVLPSFKPSWLSSTGYFSLVIIVTAAMKFSFMVGRYAGTSLDIHLPEPLLSSVLMLLQPYMPRESLELHNSQKRHQTFNQTRSAAATATSTAAGRQVVVTIDNVSEDFLSSEDYLTNAMTGMVEEEQQQQLILLSHRCHSSIISSSSSKSNIVVSCVGILPDSQMLVHAWPLQNKVRVQFFTSNQNSLLQQLQDESIIAAIYKAFAMIMPHHSSRGAAVPPRIQSSVKLRGFFTPEQQLLNLGGAASSVNDTYVLTAFNETTTTQISIQQQQQDETYYEALVHPAMLVHPNPRRVAVIGSSAATVRQVLKHNTVETVAVFANNIVCSEDLMVGNSPPAHVCLNDARVVVVVVGQDDDDAASWFIDRFSEEDDDTEDDDDDDDDETLFDVVIIDSTAVPFSLIGDAKMIDAIHNALSSKGVLVADVGIADRLGDAGWNSRNVQRLDMIKALGDAGFESVKTYTESSSSKSAAASAGSSTELRLFHIAFCDFDSKARWYMNQAEIDLELDRRMVIPTVSGAAAGASSSTSPPLNNVDGATIMSYQYPTRIVEEVYCRQIPTPRECVGGRGYDPDTPNVPITALEVKPSSIPGAGRGVFFKEYFAKGAYVSIDSGVHGMNIMPSTLSLIVKMEKNNNNETVGIAGAGDLWGPLESYVDGYGFEHIFYGFEAAAVDPGIITFVNHGCNGTNNVGSLLNVTEMNADINVVPLDISDSDSFDDEFYSPYADRNHWMFTFAQDKTQVDVKAGMEVLDNYLFFYANWTEGVTSLRSECQGIVIGTVVEYERESNKARMSDEPT